MPKVSTTKNRVIVHVGDLWKEYDKNPEDFEFRIQDTGRKGYSQRMACKRKGKWKTYAWTFSKKQVFPRKRTLYVHDDSAWKILSSLKKKGDLKGYRLVDRR